MRLRNLKVASLAEQAAELLVSDCSISEAFAVFQFDTIEWVEHILYIVFNIQCPFALRISAL